MKNVFFIFSFILCSLHASAQWELTQIKADELKGTKQYLSYVYTDSLKTGSFVFWSIYPDHFKVYSRKHLFDWMQASQYMVQKVTIGIYNENLELKKKHEMWLDTESGETHCLFTRQTNKMNRPIGQSKQAKKIIDHLSTKKGYIRIIAKQYGAEDFDLTIPCIRNNQCVNNEK